MVIVEQEETGVLLGRVASVRGCFTQGNDLAELMENVKEVLTLCLEELGLPSAADVPRLHFV